MERHEGVGRLNDEYRRSNDQPRELMALAMRQHAVVHLQQLAEIGLTARPVQYRAAAGRLHRVFRGVYALVPWDLLSRDGRCLAAVYACGPGAVLSHRAAAAVHELIENNSTKIDVTVPGRTNHAHEPIRLHRSTTLRPSDTTIVRGITCTTLGRTLLDLADQLATRRLERAFDQADVVEALDLRALEDQLRRNDTRPAARKVRALLAEHYIGTPVTWSDLEERFLALVRRRGMAAPECNALVDLGDGEPPTRPDFVWRRERVILEADGHRTHRTRQKFESDRRQDQRATVAGWVPLRTTWRQLEQRPEEPVQVVHAMVARRRAA